MPNTKIVATLGPSTDAPGVVRSLLEAGVDVFRLNASHGTQEALAERVRIVRSTASELGVHAGILLDLQGPKIRLGTFETGRLTLQTGQDFTITTEAVTGNQELASTTYADFAADVRVGDRILLNDGAAELRAITNNGTAVKCKVVCGGDIGDRKGINLPGVKVSAPSLTRKDSSDLAFGLALGVDFVALSFVRTANDVLRLKFLLEEKDAKVPVVAKIEKPEAWQNLDAIIKESDGLMVARGDLGIEMALEKVPFIQKSIIRKARAAGKFVITATQMLESMIQNGTPTRAEVSDVANAIYDGTDAVMLSGETAAGKYPVEAARMMDKIAAETEASLRARGFQPYEMGEDPSIAEIIADAAFRAAAYSRAAAIVVFSASGSTARLVSRNRPPVPLFVFTPSENTARQMSVVYGVTPLIEAEALSTDQMMEQMEHRLKNAGLVSSGDQIAFTSGQPIGKRGTTNMMKLHTIG